MIPVLYQNLGIRLLKVVFPRVDSWSTGPLGFGASHEELIKTTKYLKNEFAMKDLGKTKFYLGLQIKYFPTRVLIQQSIYTKKILKRFYMDKAYPLSSLMVVPSLDVKNDLFPSYEKGEKLLGPEVPYLSAIVTLIYLTNCTMSDIVVSVNLLAKYSSTPTQGHWNGIKHILCYLQRTIDKGLFYSNESKQQLLRYVNVRHLSYPHRVISQTMYVFNYNETVISWRSFKQIMDATIIESFKDSSNSQSKL